VTYFGISAKMNKEILNILAEWHRPLETISLTKLINWQINDILTPIHPICQKN